MANSFLQPKGLFNPSLRFAFTNISDEDFISHWDKVPVTVKAHETIELSVTTPIPGVSGHALAVKFTGELVDKIMINEAKMDELKSKDINYRSPKGTSLGVPAVRKVYEDQILRELSIDEESPAIQSLRNQMKKEILSGGKEKQTTLPPTTTAPKSVEDFADLTKKTEQEVKKPAKTQKINEASISNGNTKK